MIQGTSAMQDFSVSQRKWSNLWQLDFAIFSKRIQEDPNALSSLLVTVLEALSPHFYTRTCFLLRKKLNPSSTFSLVASNVFTA
jgi:hypothetical protein